MNLTQIPLVSYLTEHGTYDPYLTDLKGVTTSSQIPKKFRFWDFVDEGNDVLQRDRPIKKNKEGARTTLCSFVTRWR